jgi:hypothetical protein
MRDAQIHDDCIKPPADYRPFPSLGVVATMLQQFNPELSDSAAMYYASHIICDVDDNNPAQAGEHLTEALTRPACNAI